jgi:prenyltransferase beta subunit
MEAYQSATYIEQEDVQQSVVKLLRTNKADLLRSNHVSWIMKALSPEGLGQNMSSLDASRPWMCYWTLHALTLLEQPIPDDTCSGIIKLLTLCRNSDGGFGGGPGQISHLATTYAAVSALVIECLNVGPMLF